MKSYQIVKKSLDFTGPERIPMSLPEPYPDDMVSAGIGRASNGRATDWYLNEQGQERRIDEFGNVWGRLEGISKGEVFHGVIEEDWQQLDQYQFPDLAHPERYQGAKKVFANHQDKFKIGSIPGFAFNIARKMRKLENFMSDIILHQDEVNRLVQQLTELLADCIRQWSQTGADAVMFPEDWGTQDRLLIAPDMWREIFKPSFEKLCQVAHEQDLYVFMHSCGYIYNIIEDLIEVGIDLLQFDQPALHGIDNLARDFGGRVNFWCPVDIQRTLQSRDEEKIRDEARELIEKLGCDDGGFIAGYYSDLEGIGLEKKWQDIACQVFVKFSKYCKRGN